MNGDPARRWDELIREIRSIGWDHRVDESLDDLDAADFDAWLALEAPNNR